MEDKNAEIKYEDACAITNPKYQAVNKRTNCYDLINKTDRFIQLSTITKITTDNESIASDFPLKTDEYGLEPYDDYGIKVDDTYGTSLYVFVHKKNDHTCLLPILSGFSGEDKCDVILFTSNWRMREAESSFVSYISAQKEFGIAGQMMVVDTKNGIYNFAKIVVDKKNAIQGWKKSESESMKKNHVTATSSAALILQIWLHTICLWNQRCNNRKVEHKVVFSSGRKEDARDIKPYLTAPQQTIIDLKKDIVVYVNDGKVEKRKFAGYCMLESKRCGHFRHLPNGQILYIKPTTVHYKKLNPDKSLYKNRKPIVYRNTEDFLREKSYLEDDVLQALKCNGIKFEREKMFAWMGKKRLDFYLPEKNVAIECQGVQHFYPYGKDDTEFHSRRKRDEDKYLECKTHDIPIVYYKNERIPLPKDMNPEYYFVDTIDDLLSCLNA